MGLSLIKRRFISISVSLSMAFATLAPSISHAIASKSSMDSEQITMVICSIDGQQSTFQVDLGTQGDHQSHQDNCPFCTLHAPVIHRADNSLSFSQQSKTFYPALFYQAPKPLFSWIKAPSRAPPQFI